jgi:hypothetical protein
MQADDFEETRTEMLSLMADLELGKVCSKRLQMIEHRLIFLNWCVNYMADRPLPDDKVVLMMTIEFYRMKESFVEALTKISPFEQ